MAVVQEEMTREELERELMEARQRYDAVSRFLSRTSHEIRTPVNSVLGLAELGEYECTDPKAKEYFSKIHSAGDYLLAILNDILDMARIESGSVTLYPEACTLEQLAQDITAVAQPLMEQRSIDFRFEFHDIFADTLIMDKLRVNQILINLLSNAAKFTPEKGRVDCIVSQLAAYDGKICTIFRVRDNGIGMTEEFLKTVFTPFTQERNASNAAVQGTGLGLPIAKNLTELMGGRISVKSKPGKGTEFTVEIDFLPADAAAVPQGFAEGAGSFDFSGKRALVVDDHSINRILEVKVLKKAGFETDTAGNGFECMKKYLASEPGYYSVVLMDVRMPVMDGLEAVGKIRSSGRADAGSIVVVAMSANAYPEDIERSLKAGMDDHISKPVIPAVLLGRLGKLLNERKDDISKEVPEG